MQREPEETIGDQVFDAYLRHAVACRTCGLAASPERGCETGRELFAAERPQPVPGKATQERESTPVSLDTGAMRNLVNRLLAEGAQLPTYSELEMITPAAR